MPDIFFWFMSSFLRPYRSSGYRMTATRPGLAHNPNMLDFVRSYLYRPNLFDRSVPAYLLARTVRQMLII
jgi:hypothetical protein